MKRLYVAMASMPTTTDGLVTENFEQWTLVYNLADRLVEYGSKDELQTNLAKSYKVSADGKEFTFEIWPDRRFHNGDPVTIDDVIFSLDLSIRNKQTYSNLKDQLACKPGSTEEGCGAITRLSPTAFTLQLKEASPAFLEKLNMNENAIRSKRAHAKGQVVYSGPYIVSQMTQDGYELRLDEHHPKAHSSSFEVISIRRLPQDPHDISRLLADAANPTVMLSKGFPTMLSQGSKLSPDAAYQYASGNSYLIALRPDLGNIEAYKYGIQQAIMQPDALNKFPYLKPLATLYPAGYSLSSPVLFSKVDTRPGLKRLKIKCPSTAIGHELAEHLTKIFHAKGLEIEFVQVTDQVYKAPLAGSEFDGMLAFPFIDIQDEVRVARGYFSGYWNYFPSPKKDLLALLSEADKSADSDKATGLMRVFYQKLFTEYPIVPLFFAPSMILLSDAIDRRNLEFYGNTIKFELFRTVTAR